MLVFFYFMGILAAFVLGMMFGPRLRAMSKTCQDDGAPDAPSDNDLKWDPLIGPGDYWDTPKKPSKRKGKRKGK